MHPGFARIIQCSFILIQKPIELFFKCFLNVGSSSMYQLVDAQGWIKKNVDPGGVNKEYIEPGWGGLGGLIYILDDKQMRAHFS